MQHGHTHSLFRHSIIDTLGKVVESYPLVVLTAPMGYGKTTAIRSLLQNSPRRYFYIEVPPGPHNEAYLWEMAFIQLSNQSSKIAPVLQRMGFPSDPIQLQRTFEQGNKYIDSRPTVLVIDDYHYVQAPAMDQLLEAMVRRAIPGLTIIILSRTRPHMSLEDLRIKGLAAVFDHSLLTFSQEDATEYFKLHGVEDKEIAKAAWAFSEGWAAALFLSLQSYLATGNVAPMRDMEELISDTIFASYPPADKKLLIQLSILDSFTAQQASMVSDNTAAPGRLHHLHRQNAFLSYDQNSKVYRLHSIFRSYLQKRLADQPVHQGPMSASLQRSGNYYFTIDKPALFRRAGEWSAENNDPVQAMRFFFQAGREEDLLRILELMTKPSDGLYVMFDPHGISAIVNNIPWAVRFRCPIGYLAFVYHFMSRVNLERGLLLLKEAQERFAAEETISSATKRRIAGEMELMHGLVVFNDLFAMRDSHQRAHELLGGRSSISHSTLVWTFGSPHVAFLYLRDPGTYERLVKLVEKNLFYYQEMTNGCSNGAQSLFRAEYLLETGHPQHVPHHLTKAAYRANEKSQLSSIIAISFTKSRLFMADGKKRLAHDIINELAPVVASAGSPLLMNSLDLCCGYIAAMLNEESKIPSWLRDGEQATSRNFYQCQGFAQIVHGKALLVAQRWEQLESFAEELPYKTSRYKNLFGLIHAHVQQAVAAFHLHGQQLALTHLQAAVKLAKPDSIVTSIAEYGSSVYPLLLLLRDWQPNDAFVLTLVRAAKRYTFLDTKQNLTLTPREQTIMERVAKGASNKEVAEALGITPATVANTLSRVYGKIGAKNRSAAVRKWEALTQ